MKASEQQRNEAQSRSGSDLREQSRWYYDIADNCIRCSETHIIINYSEVLQILRGLESELSSITEERDDYIRQLTAIRAGHTKTVEYDLSPAMVESELRDKLTELGWASPEKYDALHRRIQEINKSLLDSPVCKAYMAEGEDEAWAHLVELTEAEEEK